MMDDFGNLLLVFPQSGNPHDVITFITHRPREALSPEESFTILRDWKQSMQGSYSYHRDRLSELPEFDSRTRNLRNRAYD